MTADPAITVEGLDVTIRGRRTTTQVLSGVSVALGTGRMHGLVGETGSGKSMTARAIVGLLPRGGVVTAGSIVVAGTQTVGLGEDELRRIRGKVVGMVFQNPRAALYPLRTVGAQMAAVLKAHVPSTSPQRVDRIREALRLVGIRDPERVAAAHPHQLSGGMAQRVVIATALLAEPRILIADEPTTGLDATVQRQILDLLAGLQQRLSLSVLMITHDLTVVAQYCGSVSVMHRGAVVESGTTRGVLGAPEHEYTKRLLEASKLTNVDRERVSMLASG